MNAPANPLRNRPAVYQLTQRDLGARGQLEAIEQVHLTGTETRECIIAFNREPSNDGRETPVDSWKGSWQWNLRTDITTWSPALFRIIGLDQDSEIPAFKEHSCFYTSDSWNQITDATLELLRTGTPYELKLQMLHTDGTRRWVIATGEAVCADRGDVVQLRGTVEDISHWRRSVARNEPQPSAKSDSDCIGSLLIEGQEAENARIASKLRDDICQRVSMMAVWIQTLRSSFPELPELAQTRFDELRQETTGILGELDRLADQLHPSALDLLGLSLAIQRRCREFSQESGFAVECICADETPEIPEKQVVLALFRVLEETLSNVAKHSQATTVTVRLSHSTAETILNISDNGVGFEPVRMKKTPGLGFVRMKERLGQVGGSLAVWSRHGRGTSVEARTPLAESCAAQPIPAPRTVM
jgi:two-component system, NarL family, sensor histidine kinase UhpB